MATTTKFVPSLQVVGGRGSTVEKLTAARPNVDERVQAGKALRAKVPRSRLGKYKPPSHRNPVGILEAQARTRLPQLVPVRYARMLASPFAFLRGGAAIMAQDLSQSPVTGIKVQVCGDMHVSNFGVFASAERNLVFSINDFDETLPGPWEWDLKRLVVSAVVAGEFLGGDRERCESRCWIILMRGLDAGDPLFLQLKEAQNSVLAPYVNAPPFENQGYRVVSGQRLIQGAPDILLGWGTVEGIHFYVRQLRDMKGSYEFDPECWTPQGFSDYCALCGWALALAHAKSGDAAMITGYVGKSEALDDAMTEFAFSYAEQNNRDYAQLQKAARSHRVKVSKVA